MVMKMKYTIEKIEDGVATLRYADESWAQIVMSSDMTEEEFDDLAHQFAPKVGSTPEFVSVGAERTATKKPVEEVVLPEPIVYPDWYLARLDAYGPVETQIEYITENGLEAWQGLVTQIKLDNPKE